MFRGLHALTAAETGTANQTGGGSGDITERVWALREQLGITRVADITGLDRMGVPVAAAYRPNSRSISVFQGKGLSVATARAAALMEAAEMFHAEFIDLPLRLASHVDLGDRALDPSQLPKCGDSRFHPHLPILWVEGRDLVSHESVFVP